jgi:hypothetical protein
MFYLFELSIGIDGQATIEQRISAPIKEPNAATVSGTAAVLPRFARRQKWGPQKWTDATRNFWTSKCEGLYRHEMMAQLL